MDLPNTTPNVTSPDVPSTPASTSATATTTLADSAHRSCAICPRRMSKLKFDLHSVCVTCRQLKCDLDNRCKECRNWTSSQMEEYLKHRRSLEGKAKKKPVPQTSAAAVVAPSSVPSSVPPSVVSVAAELARTDSSDVTNIMRLFIQSYGEAHPPPSVSVQDVLTSSFSAPLSAPDGARATQGLTGGLEDHVSTQETRSDQASGEERPGLQEPPLPKPIDLQYDTQHDIEFENINLALARDRILVREQCRKSVTSVVPATHSPESYLFPASCMNSPSPFILPPSVPTPSLPPFPPPFSVPPVSASSPLHVSHYSTTTSGLPVTTVHSSGFSFPITVASMTCSAPPSLPILPPPYSTSFPSPSPIATDSRTHSALTPSVTVHKHYRPSGPGHAHSVHNASHPLLPHTSFNFPLLSSTSSSSLSALPHLPHTQVTPANIFSSSVPVSTTDYPPPSSFASVFPLTPSPSPSPLPTPVSASLPPSTSSDTTRPLRMTSVKGAWLSEYNAGVLGLSVPYKRLAKSRFAQYKVLDRQYVYSTCPDLLPDYDKDHQNGSSVYIGSLELGASSFPPSLPSVSSVPQSVVSSVLPPTISCSSPPVSLTLPLKRELPPIQVYRRDIPVHPSTVPAPPVIPSTLPGQYGLPISANPFPLAPPPVSFSSSLYPDPVPSVSRAVGGIPQYPDLVMYPPQYPSAPVYDPQPPIVPPVPAPPPVSSLSTPSTSRSSLWSPIDPSPTNTHEFRHPAPSVPSAPGTSQGVPVFPPRTPQFVIAPDGSSVPFPQAPDLEQDPHNRSFESEPEPPNPPKWSEYRRMIEYIVAKFPQAKGEEPPQRHARAEFENLYPKSQDSTTPLPLMNLYGRVQLALSDADNRLAKSVDQGRAAKFLLPRRKAIYAVSDLPSGGVPLQPNQSLDPQLLKTLNAFRSVGLTLGECMSLEGAFRSQTEALSHSMWLLTGLLALIRDEGYVPQDENMFHQFVSSLSIGLSHQANIAAAGTSFTCLKRRELYVSHLPPIYSESMKKSLLSSPASLGSSLFKEEDVTRLSELADRGSNIKASQAVMEYMTAGHSRSRSPRRSPPRPSGSGYRPRGRSPRSPLRSSPKRVRFSPKATPKSPPAPKQNSR